MLFFNQQIEDLCSFQKLLNFDYNWQLVTKNILTLLVVFLVVAFWIFDLQNYLKLYFDTFSLSLSLSLSFSPPALSLSVSLTVSFSLFLTLLLSWASS